MENKIEFEILKALQNHKNEILCGNKDTQIIYETELSLDIEQLSNKTGFSKEDVEEKLGILFKKKQISITTYNFHHFFYITELGSSKYINIKLINSEPMRLNAGILADTQPFLSKKKITIHKFFGGLLVLINSLIYIPFTIEIICTNGGGYGIAYIFLPLTIFINSYTLTGLLAFIQFFKYPLTAKVIYYLALTISSSLRIFLILLVFLDKTYPIGPPFEVGICATLTLIPALIFLIFGIIFNKNKFIFVWNVIGGIIATLSIILILPWFLSLTYIVLFRLFHIHIA